MTSRRRAIAAVLGCVCWPYCVPAMEAGEASGAIAALRLATLAERMAKLHAQAALGMLPERSRRGIAQATREFGALLQRARSRPASPESRETMLLLAILWDEHRAWVARAPTRENARRLVERTEEVVWVAEKVARLAGGPSTPAVLAQRAALLAQRVPRLHLLRRGVENASELATAEQALAQAVAGLAQAPGNSPEALAELQLADNQMQFLARAIAEREGGARRLEFIAKAGDHLLESLERLARLYESAGP